MPLGMCTIVLHTMCLAKRAARLHTGPVYACLLLLLTAACAGVPKPEDGWKRHFQIGTKALERGDAVRAESEFLEARDFAEAIGPTDLRLSMILVALGSLYTTGARDEEAENSLRQAAAIQEKVLGSDHVQVASTLESIAHLHIRQARYEEAAATLERALAIRDGQEPVVTRAVAATLEDLAGIYTRMGRHTNAIPLLERALVIREAVDGPHDPSVVRTLGQLAEIQHRLGQNEGMFASLSRSLRILGAELTHVDSVMAGEVLRYGELLEETRLASSARRTSKRESAADPATGARAHGNATAEQKEEALLMLHAGNAKLERGHFDLAAVDFETAQAHLPDDPMLEEQLVKGYSVIGMEFYSQGRLEEAIQIWVRALAVDPKNEQVIAYLDRIRKSMKRAKEITNEK